MTLDEFRATGVWLPFGTGPRAALGESETGHWVFCGWYIWPPSNRDRRFYTGLGYFESIDEALDAILATEPDLSTDVIFQYLALAKEQEANAKNAGLLPGEHGAAGGEQDRDCLPDGVVQEGR